MSLIIQDWRCPDCGYTDEQLTQRDVVYLDCPKCGKGTRTPMPSAPTIAYLRMGVDPDFSTASDKWAKAHPNTAQA